MVPLWFQVHGRNTRRRARCYDHTVSSGHPRATELQGEEQRRLEGRCSAWAQRNLQIWRAQMKAVSEDQHSIHHERSRCAPRTCAEVGSEEGPTPTVLAVAGVAVQSGAEACRFDLFWVPELAALRSSQGRFVLPRTGHVLPSTGALTTAAVASCIGAMGMPPLLWPG